MNEEWLEGELNGKTGIFPSCFVEIKIPLPLNDEVNFSDTTMIALFNYQAQSWDDLELKVRPNIFFT